MVYCCLPPRLSSNLFMQLFLGQKPNQTYERCKFERKYDRMWHREFVMKINNIAPNRKAFSRFLILPLNQDSI